MCLNKEKIMGSKVIGSNQRRSDAHPECWHRSVDSSGQHIAPRCSIPSSRLMLSGSPDIVFLRLTFLGRRDTVSVLMRERRMLACRSNTAPGSQKGESMAGRHTGKQSVSRRNEVKNMQLFFF